MPVVVQRQALVFQTVQKTCGGPGQDFLDKEVDMPVVVPHRLPWSSIADNCGVSAVAVQRGASSTGAIVERTVCSTVAPAEKFVKCSSELRG